MLKYVGSVLCLIYLVTGADTVKAQAIHHAVPVKNIDNRLAKQFPYSKSFENVRIIFSEPKAVVNALDKNLKLQMMITHSVQEQMLLVKATFKGDIEYNDFSDSYLFENLKLDKFTIQIDSFENSQTIIKTIKQSLLNTFDDIVLLNLESFSTELPNRQADDIEISSKQIRFIWNK